MAASETMRSCSEFDLDDRNMTNRAIQSCLRFVLAFVCSAFAFAYFFGGDADFTQWSFTREFFGVRETVTWTFPVAFSFGFAILSVAIQHVIGLLPRYRDQSGLLNLEGRIAACLILGVLSAGVFVATRPPNYALSTAALGLILYTMAELLLWCASAAVLSYRKCIDWRTEAASARFVINGALVAGAIVISILLMEAALRVHNPFVLRIKGDHIVLQNNYRFIIENGTPGKLEAKIIHSRNSIGLRGEDPPADLASRLSIVTVGGSTTENYYLSDDKTWTAVLGERLAASYPAIWINNAGLAGHSTTAHLLLLDDYLSKLHPDVIVFYFGINDLIKDGLGKGDIGRLEKSVLRENNNVRPILERLSDFSELANLGANLYRRLQALQAGAAPFSLNLEGRINVENIVEPKPDETEQILSELNGAFDRYRARVVHLMETARKIGAHPVLMTQPLLAGEGSDAIEGFRLDNIEQTLLGRKVSSLAYWRLLERYNDVLRDVAAQMGVPLIDLARDVPKRSDYFIDIMHYSVAGADYIGDRIAVQLCPWLDETFTSISPARPCPQLPSTR